mmetsp:Transcript_54102/g.137420  ORF Transcript_54102/g.137420 Transcript_54102/m.137420 type:complete len:191 (-) Transcript_54102:279-851(-)
MAPMESEIRRPRAASPAPRKSAPASAGIPGDENARRGGVDNIKPQTATEEVLKSAPAKQQCGLKEEEPIEEASAAAGHPAWGTRRRVLLAVAALVGALFTVASVVTLAFGHDALAAGGAAAAAVATMAHQLVEGASIRAVSVFRGTASASAAAAAAAVLMAASFTAAIVVIAQRRRRAASTVGETKEKAA